LEYFFHGKSSLTIEVNLLKDVELSNVHISYEDLLAKGSFDSLVVSGLTVSDSSMPMVLGILARSYSIISGVTFKNFVGSFFSTKAGSGSDGMCLFSSLDFE